MRVIGVVGPAGSGKSTVARLLARRPGVAHVDCDELAWNTYRPGGRAYPALVARFGRHILSEDGTVNRGQLGRIALADPRHRVDLEGIVHPPVMAKVRAAVRRHRKRGTEILLVEGALLLSSPHVDRSLFDAFVWLDVPLEERRTRLLSAGLEEEGVNRRLSAQRELTPPEEARLSIVDARGSPEDVAKRLALLLDSGGAS